MREDDDQLTERSLSSSPPMLQYVPARVNGHTNNIKFDQFPTYRLLIIDPTNTMTRIPGVIGIPCLKLLVIVEQR